jgi:nitrite reductase (NO-forming)
MRLLASVSLLALAIGCGGSEPPKPAPTPDKPKGPDFDEMSDDEKKAHLMKLGEEVYKTGGSGGLACVTCHQANGEGLPPSFPPLKGAKEWMADCSKHAGYVINGLQGEIEVAGVKYNGVMPAQGNLSDLEIAAVISYERMSWGNDYGLCMPEVVAAAR